MLFRSTYYILPCGVPLGIGVDVSGEITVDCDMTKVGRCVVRYVVKNVLWLPYVVDWCIAVAVVFRSTVITGLEVIWPLSVVSNVRNVVHVAGDVPRDIELVLVDEAKVVVAPVLGVALLNTEITYEWFN